MQHPSRGGTTASLKASDGRDLIVWDDALPGFGVRVKVSGVKTFILQYRNRHGTSKRLSIGRVGQLTLDQARREASRMKGGICLGQDPVKERMETRAGDTLRDLAVRYMTDHCEGRCKESTMAAHRWLLDRFILPKFGARKIKELTSNDIGRFHQSLRDTPYNANRCLGLIRAMFNRAEEWGLLPPNQNPAEVIKPFSERKRQRFLSPEEFERLHDSLDELERLTIIGQHQAAAIRLLAFTGCRMGEILSLRWSDVDLDNRRLILERHKTDHKGAKAIPLNEEALAVLRSLPRLADNPFVIVGKDTGRHLVNLQKPWQRIRTHAELEDVRIHDLRHSFASAAASAGIPLQIIGGLLGHTSPQSTARYAHLSQDPLQKASDQIGKVVAWRSSHE